MKRATRWMISVAAGAALLAGEVGACFGQVLPGQSAPTFSLKGVQGSTHDLAAMVKKPMLILYFFDVESRPSQEGLLSLDELAGRYKEADLTVWGISLSSKEKLADFLTRKQLLFPLMLDTAGVSDLYQARMILPTVCIIGPGLKVLDYFQGGGKTTEVMLARLAERELQHRQTALAKALSESVIRKNPQNVSAQVVKGYAALNQGNLQEAENTFRELADKEGEGGVRGMVGLSDVYVRKGQPEKAVQLADEATRREPDNAYAHVIKGDVLYSQGRLKEAEGEYRQAAAKPSAEPFQKAVPYNKLGRLQAGAGRYQDARELYKQAVDIDPYYIEATSNTGVTYEKEGQWGKALEAYQQTLALDKHDTFAAVLARKAEEMLALQKDSARKQRIDTLVKELAERYRSQKGAEEKAGDEWTTRPMVISFVDVQEKGGLAERDGFPAVLTEALTAQLNESGRVRVIERVLIERVLEELNLGSSDLADPETATRLGRIMAVKLIGTGSANHIPSATLLSLRLIDTETTAIPKILTLQLNPGPGLEKGLFQVSREILKAVMEKYPLQGYVVETTGDQVMINLGAQQGVVLGTRFEVLQESAPIEYKGRVLHRSAQSIARLEITQVEPDLSYGRILTQERPLKTDDKVRESIEALAMQGGGDRVPR